MADQLQVVCEYCDETFTLYQDEDGTLRSAHKCVGKERLQDGSIKSPVQIKKDV